MDFEWRAPRSEVGRFLKGFRAWTKDTLDGVAERLDKGLASASPDDPLRAMVIEVLPFLQALESCTDEVTYSRSIVQQLALAYLVPPLMLDPLFSKTLPADQRCLVGSTAQFERANQNTRHYGKGIDYSIPPTKLNTGTDVAFGHLRMRPRESHSDFHDHPGTELLFLLEGKQVELRLEASGVRIPIGKHDFVHFNASIPHSLWNLSGKAASVFVIRFYQLPTVSTREGVLQFARDVAQSLMDTQDAVSDLKGVVARQKGLFNALQAKEPLEGEEYGKLKDFLIELRKQIQALDPVHKDENRRRELDLHHFVECVTHRVSSKYLERLTEEPPSTVQDLFGLALLLRRLKGDLKVKDMMKKKKGFSREDLARINRGERPLDEKELVKLADLYDVEPMLLYPFMFPTEPDVVAGRKDEMCLVPDRLTDPARYLAPRCNLALSDVSLLHVELHKGKATRLNRHPGFELAIPLNESNVRVDLEGHGSWRVSAAKNEYAYYDSNFEHAIHNVGKTPASVFVVRFYGSVGTTVNSPPESADSAD